MILIFLVSVDFPIKFFPSVKLVTMVLAKKIVYASEIQGFPTDANFRLEEEEIDVETALKDDQIALKTLCLSVDPYMRLFSKVVGEKMIGEVF